MMKNTTAPLLAALSLMAAGSAHAASISFNAADTSSAATTLTAGVLPYGVESSSNWTQGNTNASNLVDDTGTPTTLDLTVSDFTLSNFSGVIAGNTIYDYGDSHFPTAAADSWTLSEIPYAQYKIIVYVSGNNLVQGSITDGATTFYWDDAANKSTAAQTFTEITDTSSAGTPVFGNYVVFGSDLSPLSGASKTISWDATGGAGASIVNGFQVVQVPEPGSLALLGLVGLLIARRKR